ncbi:ankyrin repeat domain-containing protein [Novosphingobium colocasiae]|uniref:ankyrin repeat domain-containing protein n=1 Tax=Novosphingobium colocasiae TaxID=1256513 RepID=UPI0035AF4F90
MSKLSERPALSLLRAGIRGTRRFAPLALALALVPALIVPQAARAQFSESYKFLEAVRKKDGEKVEKALMDSSNRIVMTKDVTTGETALHIVTARRDSTWLNYLISKGAEVNARDDHGKTALQIAVGLGWREGVETLLGNHANPNETDDSGETPLITAVHNKDLQITKLLLAAGGDPDRNDNSGRSARDYALLAGKDSPIVQVIQSVVAQKGAKTAKPVYGPTFR